MIIEYMGTNMEIQMTEDKYIIQGLYNNERREYDRDGTDTALLNAMGNYKEYMERLN